MLDALSIRITNFLISSNVISEKAKELYIYGTKLAISSLINVLICLLISAVMGQPANGIIFFLAFSSLRKFTGGFHCKRFLNCNLSFALTVFVALLSAKALTGYENTAFLIGLNVASAIIILIFAPVYNENKQLDDRERIKYKVISLVVLLLQIGVYISLKLFFGICLNIIPITIAIVMLMIFLGIAYNKIQIAFRSN